MNIDSLELLVDLLKPLVLFLTLKMTHHFNKRFIDKMDGWECSKDGHFLYKVVNHIPTTIQIYRKTQHIYFSLAGVLKDEKEHIIQYLKEKEDKLEILEYSFENDTLKVELFSYTEINDLQKLLSETIEYITTIYTKTDVCHICQQDRAYNEVKIEGIFYKAHLECIHNKQEESEQPIRTYKTGIMASLYVSLIILVSFTIVQLYLLKGVEHKLIIIIYQLLFLSLPPLFYIFKGKKGKWTKSILFMMLMISVFIVDFWPMILGVTSSNLGSQLISSTMDGLSLGIVLLIILDDINFEGKTIDY